MVSNYIEIFRNTLSKYKISQKELAVAAGRSQNNISEILNGKVSPSIDSFGMLLDTCDQLKPGFKDEYFRTVQGDKIDLQKLVNSLNSVEFGMLLMCAGQRVQERVQDRVAVTS
jgi:hypothetical protein